MPVSLLLLIVLAMIFDFLNGFRDSASLVATIIASRTLSPQQALWIAALAEFAGPFIFGVAVARTWGSNLLEPASVRLSIILIALTAAILWSIITGLLGIPSSSSHALAGGLVGAAIVESGWGAVKVNGAVKVLTALAISPPAGLLIGYLAMKLILYLARDATPRINGFFRAGQILTGITLALSYGANDAQKTMGIVTLGLVGGGVLQTFDVPIWVVALSAGTVAAGMAIGSRRLIRTLGMKFFKVRPVHGFTTQVAAASVILGASLTGGPVSSTHVISTAILGVGSAERISKVRWGVATQISIVWLTTIPVTSLLAAGLALLMKRWT